MTFLIVIYTVKYIALIVVLLTAACGDTPSGKLFTKISPSSSNINFKNILIEDEEFNVLNYPYFYNGGGVAVGDINNDGLTDIFFTGNMVKNRLYLNKGDMKFEDITVNSTVADKQGWCTGATMADVNADGWLDIYVCRSADGNKERRKNMLYINNHDNTFTDQAEQYGVADAGYSTHAAFFDYDKDNDLDLVVINHSQKEYMQGQQEKPGIRQQKNPDYSTHLYRNDNGRYSNVTDAAGITSNVLTFGLGVAVRDHNNDSCLDIYNSNNINEADYCFINQKNGTFKEMSREMFPYTSLFSMGNNASDINNDGWMDLITLDMLPEGNYLQKMHNGSENFDKFQYLFSKGFFQQYSRNMLQVNRGDGTFDETGQFSGISNTDWSWAPLAADFNNDGKKDVFVSNGYVKDYTDMDYIKYNVDMIMERDPAKQQEMMKNRMNKLPEIKIANYIFCNEGDLKFSNKTKDWGLDELVISAGAAYADLDNDGDLDIITNNCNEEASVYRNDLNKDSASYIDIQLKGEASNTFGIGAKVQVLTTSGMQVQEMMPSRGFQSSVDYKLHFGIPKNDSVKEVIVYWMNDKTSSISSPGKNKLISIDIKQSQLRTSHSSSVVGPKTILTFTDSLPFKHTENIYNDFTQQVLLPQWFSRQGPALASGDLNGDKIEDIYIGGAKGQAGAIFLQDRSGKFRKLADAVIAADAAYEDITAAIFDADGDGDNDLIVGSGGYELQPNDPLLQNRLYLNAGNGNFTKSNRFPADLINDNAIAIGDYNGDGAMDIFNGGFCVPGKYPEASGSQMLINDGKGNFAKPAGALLKNFDANNLVTSAAAADINKDGKTDLVVAGHWMGVEIWMNRGSYFEKDTAAYSSPHGLYNTVETTDIDGDGDIDIIAGNQGLNNQFVTTAEEPMEMYYADFDGNGTTEPVISYYIDHKSWPIYSRDDLVQQIPAFNKKFLFFSDYAKADMNAVFEEKLKTAKRYYASQMASIILVNTNGKFIEQSLPKEAQWYPVYAIAVTDRKDIIAGGNQSYSRIKFGAYGTGRGDVFMNKGKNEFERLSPQQSGLNIRGDVRNAVVAGSTVVFGINNQQPLVYSIKK